MRGSWYSVAPRYTAGSPAQVDQATAARVVEEERRAYPPTLEGVYGAEAKAEAEAKGLRGIVWSWRQRGALIVWHDEITEESGEIKIRAGVPGIPWPWTTAAIPRARIHTWGTCARRGVGMHGSLPHNCFSGLLHGGGGCACAWCQEPVIPGATAHERADGL